MKKTGQILGITLLPQGPWISPFPGPPFLPCLYRYANPALMRLISYFAKSMPTPAPQEATGRSAQNR
jgi:hypothetical protein